MEFHILAFLQKNGQIFQEKKLQKKNLLSAFMNNIFDLLHNNIKKVYSPNSKKIDFWGIIFYNIYGGLK